MLTSGVDQSKVTSVGVNASSPNICDSVRSTSVHNNENRTRAVSPRQAFMMPPPVRLGIVTDIQYAAKEDTYIEYTKKVRYYTNALIKSRIAVTQLNKYELLATLHLGDIIDGNVDIDNTRKDLDAVIDTLSALDKPVRHVLGNHCLDAGRDYLLKRLGMERGYYSFEAGDWCIVVLDTVDISVSREEPYRTLALKYLEEHKGEINANDWNGGLSQEQKSWLGAVLSKAKESGKNILACGHLPIVCNGTEEHILWEADEIHEMFKHFGVRAYFAGHYHEGDYVHKGGIHYVTFESILDSTSENGSYGVAELFDRKIVISGYGDMTSRTLEFHRRSEYTRSP